MRRWLADFDWASEVLTQVGLAGQLVVLVLLVGSGVWAYRRPGSLPVIAWALCCLMWSRANTQLEGGVLITFEPGRGLTLADLLVPAVCCLVLLGRVSRRRRAGRPASATLAAELTR